MESNNVNTPLFDLGRLLATPGALALLDRVGIDGMALLARHIRGDWGDVSPDDAAVNEEALRDRARILSSYAVGGERIWIITEADRSATTLLLPADY